MSWIFVFIATTLLVSAKETDNDLLDRGPVDPEFATIVNDVEKLSCVKSRALRARPFSECERLRLDLRGTFATIRRYRDQYVAESEKLSKALAKQADIDSGSQCAVAVINDRVYAFSRTLEDRTVHNIKFAERVAEGLGPKPWPELKAFTNQATKVACFGACGQHQMPNCEAQCQITKNAVSRFEKVVAFPAAQLVPPGLGHAHLREALNELKALSAVAGRVKKELEGSLERTRKMAADSQASGRQIAGAYDCERRKKELEERVKGATALLNMPAKNERGSGVFVRTHGPGGEETHLLTANHVPGVMAEGGKINRHVPTEVVPSTEAEKGDRPIQEIPGTSVERFEIEPGRVHASEDLISKPVPPLPNALGVVPTGTQPEVGQEFYVSGHPGTYGSEFVAHRCTFEGYGTGDWGTETHYYLHCPSAVSGQWGMSGGPMYDTSGRVWGVASQQPGFTNLIRVAPVSQSPEGKLQLGLQEIFFTDYCRSPDAPGYRRCQIIPGYGWSTSGP